MRVASFVGRWKRRRARKLDEQRYRLAALGIPDISRGKLIYPHVRYIEGVRESLALIEADGGFRVSFIGNWWIEGNPYKGLNVVLTANRRPRWAYAIAKALWIRGLPTLGFPLPTNSELQFHTEESSAVAERNHHLYEILRDKNQPLVVRQQAFDKMAASFARVACPSNIGSIGTPITVSRPAPSPEERLATELENIAQSTGSTIIWKKPQYPRDLQKLLDQARELSGPRPNLALQYFDEIVRKYSDCDDLESQRGVAIALINSGQLLTQLKRYDDAIVMFERAIAKAGTDEDLELEALNAASLREVAKGRQDRD